MHLQLGSRADHRRIGRTWARLLVGVALTLGAACASPSAAGIHTEWVVQTADPVVGAPVVAELTLRRAGRAVTGARLGISGQMAHPGMPPVVGTVEENADGVYRIHLRLPMAGDWSVIVSGALSDGRVVNERFPIANVRPSG